MRRLNNLKIAFREGRRANLIVVETSATAILLQNFRAETTWSYACGFNPVLPLSILQMESYEALLVGAYQGSGHGARPCGDDEGGLHAKRELG